MALVKLEINGKRIVARDDQTILAVARQNGINDIPTLCHDEQLEPFASCYVCVVKVKGARTLLPSCSTRVTEGMVIETENAEVTRARKTAVELLLSNHWADCVAPCQDTCPANVDVQGYLALAALGKYQEAIRLIKEKNPLPAICGRVCTRPCEVTGCRRGLLDQPVGIDFVKRFVADHDLAQAQPVRPDLPPPNGKRVAVVGAGPGGLSCAYYLAKRGYAVQMFEAQPEAGGMLRYGIPAYRLPKDVLDAEISQILALGVGLKTNVALGRDFTVASLKKDGHDAVFLALGAWESSTMRVKGEDAPGVLRGIEFLKNVGLRQKIELGGKVVVVGGGNTAIDCARTALRLGASEVALYYRRTRAEMPANAMEIEEALHEGVKIEFLVAPTEVLTSGGRVSGLRCVRMELGPADASGRRSPQTIKGSEHDVPCDWVIAAIGQGTTMKQLTGAGAPQLLPAGEALKLTRWETVQVNSATFETTVESVFAGGDVVTGAATVIEAVAAGRKAAHAIDSFMTTGRAEPEPAAFVSKKSVFGKVTSDQLVPSKRLTQRPMPMLSPAERNGSFAEVELGYKTEDVDQETARCLECGCAATFDCTLRDLATRTGASQKHFLGEVKQYRIDRSHPLIELDPSRCILCGRCIRICSENLAIGAFGFVNRGFGTVVKPALGGSLLDTECVSCGQCVGTCPTGAITPRLPLAKPGPWVTNAVTSTCHYCGVGCELSMEAQGTTFVTPKRLEDSHALGNHCRRGLFGYEYVQAADRVLTGKVRNGRDLQDASVEDALRFAGKRLEELSARLSPDQIAVFVSPRLTNEEIYLAQKLARTALKTNNISSFAALANPEHFCPDVVSTASYADLVGAQVVLTVGADLDRDRFTIDVLSKRALQRGARLICIGPTADRTTRVADVHLVCRPGTESWVMLGLLGELPEVEAPQLRALGARLTAEQIETLTGVPRAELRRAAKLLQDAAKRVVVFDHDLRRERAPHDVRLYADFARAVGAGMLALHEKANMQGLLDMGAQPGWLPGYQSAEGPRGSLAAALAEKRIRAAIVLGEDPLGSAALPETVRQGLRELELLIVGDLFLTPTAEAAHVFLPLSSPVETEGTMTSSERRVQRLRRSIPARSGVETWQLLTRLAAGINAQAPMSYASPAEVFAEIQRTVPLYSGVNPGAEGAASFWDLASFPLPAQAATAPEPLAATASPRATVELDCLERRFAQRFDQLMEKARAAHEAAVLAAATRT